MVLLARGDRDAAVRELERLLVLDPDDHGARIDLALHALASGDQAGALAQLDRVLGAAPDEPRALFYRAVVADLLGEDGAESELATIAAGDGPFAERARQHLADRKANDAHDAPGDSTDG